MRNFFAGLGGSSGAVAAGIVCLVLIAAGFWVQSGRSVLQVPTEVSTDRPKAELTEAAVTPDRKGAPTAGTVVSDPAETAETRQVSAAQTAVVEPSEQTSEGDPALSEESTVIETPQTVEAAPAPSPEFDEVRREADGVTVIAGRGVPGAEVQVLQNGAKVASTTTDRSGKFATIALIPPDGEGHVLTLMQVTDGGEQLSDGEIILAPLSPPPVVAAVPAPQLQETQQQDPTPDISETDEVTNEPDTIVAALKPQSAAEPPKPAKEPRSTDQTDIQNVTDADQAETTQIVESVEGEPSPQPRTTEAPQTEVAATAPQQRLAEQAPLQPTTSETPSEPAPVAVLRSTRQGVELLNTPSPEVMDNVAIDTISYSDSGDVQLSGRAQAKATAVRVYLDNTVVVNLPVDEEGRWRGDLPNVDEGIYTLRIDEVAADGAVTSRVETPFKREAPATLAAAAEERDGPISAITVQRGATLWAIARDRYGDGQLYVRVFEANRQSIRDPDLIYPGQIFDLPD